MVLMASRPPRILPQQGRLLPKLLVVAEGWLGMTELTPEARRLRRGWGRWLSLQQASVLHPGFQVCGAAVSGGELGTCGVHVQQPCPGHFSHLGNQTPSPDV